MEIDYLDLQQIITVNYQEELTEKGKELKEIVEWL